MSVLDTLTDADIMEWAERVRQVRQSVGMIHMELCMLSKSLDNETLRRIAREAGEARIALHALAERLSGIEARLPLFRGG